MHIASVNGNNHSFSLISIQTASKVVLRAVYPILVQALSTRFVQAKRGYCECARAMPSCVLLDDFSPTQPGTYCFGDGLNNIRVGIHGRFGVSKLFMPLHLRYTVAAATALTPYQYRCCHHYTHATPLHILRQPARPVSSSSAPIRRTPTQRNVSSASPTLPCVSRSVVVAVEHPQTAPPRL